ncbi:DegQ family serine endoprotease [Azospirillum canadense]|uniref:DegQ family serine endoprotease n=1 Tax=Azospirillum canadense TaxID=403962 RepID=UPI0022268407|nr:DegQ family serine endoprotease [Azospirillum canadense]MCW2240219.1 serine protease Do [Azospirillum canadense]
MPANLTTPTPQNIARRHARTPLGLRLVLVAAGIAAAPAFCGAALAQSQAPAPALNQTPAVDTGLDRLPSFRPMVEKVMPAVVNISVIERATASQMAEAGPGVPEGVPFDEMLRRFFNGPDQSAPQTGPRMALGSGFIISADGYVVTNNHVAGDADKVTVIFQDGTKHPAKVIGTDDKTDLALLKIDSDRPLPYLNFGDSDDAKPGDWAVAVGNPFGLGGSVSAGIVSARGRDLHSGPYDDFLQLDAPINRGNSGGPTFNTRGEVIGINTAILSPSGGSIGIGFAIPSNLAKPVVAQLKEHGKVTRGWLGVSIQEVTPDIATALGLPEPKGALVTDVTEGGPAAKGGLRPGDLIEAYNGQPIEQSHDLPKLVANTAVGQPAQLTVRRQGRDETIRASVGEMPADKAVASGGTGEPSGGEALGLALGELTPQVARQLHLAGNAKGALVVAVERDGIAAAAGIRPGDVIEQVDQQPMRDATAAAKRLSASLEHDKRALLLIDRAGQRQFVAVSTEGGHG